jgi:hypothetical protein
VAAELFYLDLIPAKNKFSMSVFYNFSIALYFIFAQAKFEGDKNENK